jgi:two-component system CheB/CheR fusion protein
MASNDGRLEWPDVVAIGASAGGSDALARLFSCLPKRLPFAFVILQRLSPEFMQLMIEVLSSLTEMTIKPVNDDNIPLEPSTIYLMPVRSEIRLVGGRIRVHQPGRNEGVVGPIDSFFISLAEAMGMSAMGIVLSGSGKDAVQGSVRVLEKGGRIWVQQPSTAKFPGMPNAVLQACRGAEVLPIETIAEKLVGRRTLAIRPPSLNDQSTDAVIGSLQFCMNSDCDRLLEQFDRAHIDRTINLFMVNHRLDDMDIFAARLAGNRSLAMALAREIQCPGIFFDQDKTCLDFFATRAIPNLIDRVNRGHAVRIWLPAIGGHEEANVFASMITAEFGANKVPPTITIVAEHQEGPAVSVEDIGNEGPEMGLSCLVAPTCLQEEGEEAVNNSFPTAASRMLRFESADLLTAPPPGKFDLIICNNILGHLSERARGRFMTRLADGLNSTGTLVVLSQDREMVDKAKFAAIEPAYPAFRIRERLGRHDLSVTEDIRFSSTPDISQSVRLASRKARQRLLELYAPPSLIVDIPEIVEQIGNTAPLFEEMNITATTLNLSSLKKQLRQLLEPALHGSKPLKKIVRPETRVALSDGIVLDRIRLERLPGQDGSSRYLLAFEISEIDPGESDVSQMEISSRHDRTAT